MYDRSFIAPPNDDWEGALFDLNIECDYSRVMKGKMAEAHFANWTIPGNPDSKSNIVVKTQSIRNPGDLNDTAYRELMIHMELSKHNFRGIAGFHGWFKSNGNKGRYGREYMNFILERADDSLQHYISQNSGKISVDAYKSILFQILHVLYETQTNCKFIHHDLHFKNIIIKYVVKTDPICYFDFNGQKFENSSDILIKLIDFGASRIEINDETVIYNSGNKIIGDLFNPFIDINSVNTNLKLFKVDWTGASDLCRSLHKNLKQIMGKSHNHFDWCILLGHPFFQSMIYKDSHKINSIRQEYNDDVTPIHKRRKK